MSAIPERSPTSSAKLGYTGTLSRFGCEQVSLGEECTLEYVHADPDTCRSPAPL